MDTFVDAVQDLGSICIHCHLENNLYLWPNKWLLTNYKLIFVSLYWLYDMTIEIKIIVDKSLYINFVCLRSFNKTENTYDQIDECQSILHNTKNIYDFVVSS